MPKSRAFAFALVLMVLIGMTLLLGQSGAATSSTTWPAASGRAAQNKFVGRWSSRNRNSSGEVFDDGVLDISNATSADEVSVWHSARGGPVIGHTMSYPDRIEIQISLGDGRVAHYNGVLVSAKRIEGRYFITSNRQSHHSRKPSSVEDDEWTAKGGGG